ncbi:hypothetical protein MNB_SV-6-137 [hydrothermal vent metagenome]|uniref:Thioredoxin domain-containing protein n=1 Tax=hydrothermal vent metagenome TaxID=652676 RepID=A0A1W1BWH7_9ZZZZ
MMSKLLMSLLVVTATLSARVSDKDLTEFFKSFVIRSYSAKVSKMDIKEIKKVEGHPEWEAYSVVMKVMRKKQELPVDLTILVNGDLMTTMLVDANRGVDYTHRVKKSVGSLYAGSKNGQVNAKVITTYMKNFYLKAPYNENVKAKIVDVQSVKGHAPWSAYLAIITFQNRGQDVSIPKIIFSDGKLMTTELVDYKKKIDFSREIKPKLPESIYDSSHLLFGNQNAKHKLVVFSDPQCPFCMEIVPKIMKAAKEHPDTIALYYYHFPLIQLHPVSEVLVRIIHVAQELGRKDIVEKIYTLKIDPRERDVDRIIKAVKDHTGFPVTKEQIDDPKVLATIKKDEESAEELMVSGTPTVFVDGKWDKMRNRYKLLIK